MRRILVNSAVAISAILFVAFCYVWVRSYTRANAVHVSRSDWPAADVCVVRSLTVRVVLGHVLASWRRDDYDLTVPGVTRFHHVSEVPAFRQMYAPGVRWEHVGFDVRLGQQPPINVGGNAITPNFVASNYLLDVPMRYGFGTRDESPRTYRGRTTAAHYAIAPAWVTAAVLALLPIL